MSDFDPKAYVQMDEAPAFDPKAYLSGKGGAPDVLITDGAGQAALEHFGNAAAMGYLPQAQALASKAMPDPNADLDAKLRAQGFDVRNADDSYLANRDANIARLQQQSKDHPIASGIGTVGGILAGGSLLSGLQGARAATLAGRVVQGAKTGALMGAAANPGDTEGEIDPLQLGMRASNAKVGGAIGGALPVVTQGLGYGFDKAKDYFSNAAALKAARALGRPTPTQATQMAASGQDAQIGRTLLDEGAIPVFGTPSRIAARVDDIKEGLGQRIGDLIDSAGDGKAIDAQKLGVHILESPELEAMRRTPGMESTVSAIEKQVETLAKNGDMTLKEAQALRQGIDKSINFNKAAPDMRGAQEGLYQQRTAIRDAMNNSINDLNPGAGKDALLTANRNYGNMQKASDILEREMGRNQANRGFSLTDTIAGAAGLAKGGPLGAAIAGGVNKFGRTFGNSIQARGYDAIANALPSMSRAASSIESNPVIAQRAIQSAAMPAQNESAPNMNIDQKTLGIFKENPDLLDQIKDPKMKAAIQREIGRAPAEGKAHGGVIPGKAQVSGDSRKNDTVPIMASPGEGFIPRSHMTSRAKAHEFVDQMFSGKHGGSKSHYSDGGTVPSGETLGSIIGYPGFPKPKPKAMAHGGVVPKVDPSIAKYAKQKGISYDAAKQYLMKGKKR